MFWAVSGIISAGKSKLVTQFEQEQGFLALREPVHLDEGNRFRNPYLVDFYRLMDKHGRLREEMQTESWNMAGEYGENLERLQHVSYAMQVALLGMRYELHQEAVILSRGGKEVIQDRVIFEDYIFANMLNKHPDCLITDRDFKSYCQLLSCMRWTTMNPDVTLFLRVTPETAYRRYLKRARPGEKLTLEYLTELARHYEQYVQDMRMRSLVIDIDWNEDDLPLSYILERVRAVIPRYAAFLGSPNRKAMDIVQPSPWFDPSATGATFNTPVL